MVNPSPISPRKTKQQNQTQMKKTTTLATVVAVTLMGSALCQAQDAPKKAPNPQQKFEKLDADKNGSVSSDEFKANAKDPAKADKQFAKLDADKNGSLSLEEFSAAKPKKPKKKKPAAPAAPAAE